MSRSTSARPRSSSRTAPPTTHASCPASTSPAWSSIDDRPARPPWIPVDPANELVVDRPRHPSVGFGGHARAEDRHRGPDRLLVVELDGEGVHRDRPDHAPRLAGHAHLGAGQVAAKAVRVADGDDPDPRGLLRHEAPPVARALARLQLLDLREVASPGERRLEP